MSKNFLKKCASSGCSGATAPECGEICPAGWFCAFGDVFDEDLRETECRTGRCIRYDPDSASPDTPIALPDSMCQRCEQGYVILHWEDSYISDSGTGDCEYVSDCPEICLNYDNSAVADACNNASSCPKTGCATQYDCNQDGVFEGECPDEGTKQLCGKDGPNHCWAETHAECIEGRNKTGEQTISCCRCDGCDPNPCVTPCPNACDPTEENPCPGGGTCQNVPVLGGGCGTYYICF